MSGRRIDVDDLSMPERMKMTQKTTTAPNASWGFPWLFAGKLRPGRETRAQEIARLASLVEEQVAILDSAIESAKSIRGVVSEIQEATR